MMVPVNPIIQAAPFIQAAPGLQKRAAANTAPVHVPSPLPMETSSSREFRNEVKDLRKFLTDGKAVLTKAIKEKNALMERQGFLSTVYTVALVAAWVLGISLAIVAPIVTGISLLSLQVTAVAVAALFIASILAPSGGLAAAAMYTEKKIKKADDAYRSYANEIAALHQQIRLADTICKPLEVADVLKSYALNGRAEAILKEEEKQTRKIESSLLAFGKVVLEQQQFLEETRELKSHIANETPLVQKLYRKVALQIQQSRPHVEALFKQMRIQLAKTFRFLASAVQP